MADAIRVCVAGYRGKVGGVLAAAFQSEPGVEYVGGVTRGDDLASFLHEKRPQALVDFTRPSEAMHNALAAVAAGACPVVGTTGLSAADIDKLETACAQKKIGGIVAPNFAVGAVLMMHLADIAAPHFEAAEVIELHHAGKLDAPSGTALSTARRLAARRKEKPFAHRKAEKETLAGTRGGEVIFGLPGQTLTIAHRTTSREAYVPGVLLAIRRVTAEPRFYRGLDELLGLS